jgi:ABC-type sulfate/molybdate transport systems ATPase subunit
VLTLDANRPEDCLCLTRSRASGTMRPESGRAELFCVTHNQIEAITMADKFVALGDGIIEPVAAPWVPTQHLIRFDVRVTSLREVSVSPLREHRAHLLNRYQMRSGAQRSYRSRQMPLSHRPHCLGKLRIVAAILQRKAIEKILNHMGLNPQPLPRGLARGQMAF